MDNQHQKIKGYRDLSQAEIDLMNRVKGLGPLIEGVIADVRLHIDSQRAEAHTVAVDEDKHDETDRLSLAEPERWLALGKTHAQESLMAITRAIAQPGFF